MKQGLYPNIPFADYVKIEAKNNSYLGKMVSCPAGALVEQEETEALSFGRALHTFVLEGESVFVEEFVVAPKVDRRTKVGKAIWAEFQLNNVGKSLVTQDEKDSLPEIDLAIRSHPIAREMLEGCKAVEQTIVWKDRETGILCKGRIDILPPDDKRTLVDLKSTTDASRRAFEYFSANKYHYARQGAFYLDGINTIYQKDLDNITAYSDNLNSIYDNFTFIAVEKKPPYKVGVFTLSDDFIEGGRKRYKKLLNLDQKCKAENHYPNYESGIVEVLEPPMFYMNEED